MTGEAEPEGTQESGGALRAQLEAALAERTQWQSVAAAQTASRFNHVTAEDLSGVPHDQLEAKATEVSAARVQERQSILESELAARGLTAEQITQALATPVTGKQAPSQPNLEHLGSLPGGRPATVDFEGLTGPDLIRAAVSAR
jgi:hypothetical protein